VKDTGEREGEIEKIQMEFELQITLLEHQVIQNKATGICCCKVFLSQPNSTSTGVGARLNNG
jgi:hypothetical protein